MRCFSVDEKEVQGIDLVEHEGRLHVEVGDTLLPLDAALSTELLAARERVIQRLGECIETGSYQGRTIDKEDLRELEDILVELTERGSIRLLTAHLEGTTISKEKRNQPEGLILVHTLAGSRGHIKHKSTTQMEVVNEQGRVERAFRDEFPPPGIEVVATGQLSRSNRSYLLKMLPSSSFRIERSGSLGGAPHALTISWEGHVGPTGQAPLWVRSAY